MEKLREKINKLIKETKIRKSWDYNSTSKSLTTYSQIRWNTFLIDVIKNVDVLLKKESIDADCIITSPEVGVIFSDFESFVYSSSNEYYGDKDNEVGAICNMGVLLNKYKILIDPYLPADKIVIGVESKIRDISDTTIGVITVENLLTFGTNIGSNTSPMSRKTYDVDVKHVALYYCNIGNLDDSDIDAWITKEGNKLKEALGSKFRVIVVPVRQRESNIEFHNF